MNNSLLTHLKIPTSPSDMIPSNSTPSSHIQLPSIPQQQQQQQHHHHPDSIISEEQQALLTSFTTSDSVTADNNNINYNNHNNNNHNNDSQLHPNTPSQSNSNYENDTRLSFATQQSPIVSSSSSTTSPPLQTTTDSNDDDDDLEQQRLPPLSSNSNLSNPRQSTRTKIISMFHKYIPIKQTYERINNGLTTGRMQLNAPGRFIGQGTDGVFRNLMAKPDLESSLQQQETNPPSYEEAAADAAPEYWDLNVISPMYEDEVFVEGLPVGNIANFVWNGLVSVAFQFVGFILCYLLHTSHAAKEGLKVGLGITLVMYGWDIVPANFGHLDKIPKKYLIDDANLFDGIDKSTKISSKRVDMYGDHDHSSKIGSGVDGNKSAPYVAYGLIAFGLFIIIKGFVDFYRVKSTEKRILAPLLRNNNAEENVTSVTEHVDNAEEDR